MRFASQEEIYRYARQFTDATNLGICLWATDKDDLRHLHPSNVPFDAFGRLADLPNVIALKIMATMDPAAHLELCERLGDRLLPGPVNLQLIPLLARHYGVQWSGAWTQEGLQSPEQPYAVEFFQHLQAGHFDEAMPLYWQRLAPAFAGLMRIVAPFLPTGRYPALHQKYYQWCVGGNGGLVRPPVPELTAQDREAIKATYRAIGITPREPDEESFVGRANYAKGLRPAALAAR